MNNVFSDPGAAYQNSRPERLLAEYLRDLLRNAENLPTGLPSLQAAHIDVIEEIGSAEPMVIILLPGDRGFSIAVKYTPGKGTP